MQKKYIDELKLNKDKIVQEKWNIHSGNEEEIFMRQGEIDLLTKENDEAIKSIADTTKLNKKLSKLSDIKSTLVEKHKAHSNMVGFFQNNNDCPTCEQHIDETFKETMIVKRQGEADKLMDGLKELDPVGYVRFASVYRNFREVKDFEQFVDKLDVYKRK